MKKLASLVIILAVLILGGYYGMGFLTEKTIKRNIELINQDNGISAAISEYNRGFFCSNARIKWQMHLPARVTKDDQGQPVISIAKDYTIEMPVKIYHGPVMIADKKLLFGMGYAKAKLPLPDNYLQQFDAMFTQDSVKPELQIAIFVNYLNKSTLDLTVPSFKLVTKDGKAQLNWTRSKSTSTITSGAKKVAGDLMLGGVTFTKENGKISASGATTEYDLNKNVNGMFLGNAKFSLPSFTVEENGKKLFAITKLSMSSDSGIDKNLFSTHFRTSFDTLVANDQTYGPGDMEISVRNLDADVLARLNEQASTLQKSPDAEQKKIMFSMLPELPKLFAQGAELEVSAFNVKLPQGMIKGNLIISLPKGQSSNPFDLFQKIKGHAKLKIPADVVKQLMHQSVLQQLAKQPELQQVLIQQLQPATTAAQPVQPVQPVQPTTATGPADATTPALTNEQIATMQTDKQLAGLVQSGLIVLQGSDYAIDLSLEQGKFSVNGKPYDPSVPIKL